MEIKNINEKQGLEQLYNQDALTIEGLAPESIPDFVEWFTENGGEYTGVYKVYICSVMVLLFYTIYCNIRLTSNAADAAETGYKLIELGECNHGGVFLCLFL